jgi:hypothetical protein
LGGFALAVLVLRTVQLSRLSAWQRRRGRRSPWSALPGIVWLLLPAGLLAAVPALVRAAAGRTFTFWQLCLAMPDVIIAMAVAALMGTALAVGRIAALVRRSPAAGPG